MKSLNLPNLVVDEIESFLVDLNYVQHTDSENISYERCIIRFGLHFGGEINHKISKKNPWEELKLLNRRATDVKFSFPCDR